MNISLKNYQIQRLVNSVPTKIIQNFICNNNKVIYKHTMVYTKIIMLSKFIEINFRNLDYNVSAKFVTKVLIINIITVMNEIILSKM